MTKQKPIFEVHHDEREPQPIPTKTDEKARRIAIVEKYKKQNPVKYETKKAALQKWVDEV